MNLAVQLAPSPLWVKCPICADALQIGPRGEFRCDSGCKSEHIRTLILPIARQSGDDDGEDPMRDMRTLEGISLATLRKLLIPEPKWMVDGYIEEGSFSILFGPPNVGKTILAAWLIMQALKAGYRVKFIEAEGGAFSLRKRLLRAADAEIAIGNALDEDRLNISWGVYLNLSDEDHLFKLARSMDGFDLCVLDSLHAMSGGIDENSHEWGAVANGIAWARTNSNCAIQGLHHSSKIAWKPGEAPSLANLRGHGALAGRADVALAAAPVSPDEEEEDHVTFKLWDLKQREQAKNRPKLCRCTMVGPHANMVISDLDLGEKKRPEQRITHEFLEAVEAMLPWDGGVSKTYLTNNITARAENTRAAVDQLVHSGRALELKRGRYVRSDRRNPSQARPNPSGTGAESQPVRPSPPFRGRDGTGTGPENANVTASRPGREEEDDP